MVEIYYTINERESSRNIFAETVDQAVAIFREEFGEDYIIFRTVGPWKIE
jgi:hypothetical protein